MRKKLLLCVIFALTLVGGAVAASSLPEPFASDVSAVGADLTAAQASLADAQAAMEKVQASVAKLQADLEAAASTSTSTATPTTTTVPATSTTVPTTTATSPSGTDVVSNDKTWNCPGEVNLDSVSVTISPGASSTDGVVLKNGCTGYIGHIEVVNYKGDGIHITNAHDLVIGSVTIRCYSHSDGKHQDGIQVLGGQRVTVNNADVGCYSANNSQVWINDGAGGNGPGGRPTDVVFVGGKFQGYFNGGQYGPGGAYGVSVGDSLRSGFRGAVICPNAHMARQFNVSDSATSPVNEGNTLAGAC